MPERAVMIGSHRGFAHGQLQIRIADLAFLFWFIRGLKIALIFLFFQDNPRVGTAVDGLISALLVCLLFLLWILGATVHRRELPTGAKLVFLYLGWTGLSLTWTRAASFTAAFGFWGIMFFDVLMIFFLAQMSEIRRIITRSFQGIILSAILTASIAFAMSGSTEGGRLGSTEFLHPNVIGNYTAIAAICALHLAITAKRNSPDRMLGILALIILTPIFLLFLSKTAIVAFTLAAGIYLFKSNASTSRKIAILSVALLIIVLSYSTVYTYIEAYISRGEGRLIRTLTGRTIIWAETWQMIQANRLLGYGVMSFRDVVPLPFENVIITAHNEWLNQWFTYGIIGMILAILIYVFFIKQVRVALRSDVFSLKQLGTLGLALVLYTLARGMVEADRTGLVFQLPLLLLILFGLSRYERTGQ